MTDAFSQAVAEFNKQVRDKAAEYLSEGRAGPDACYRMAEGFVIHHRAHVFDMKIREDRKVIPFKRKKTDGRVGTRAHPMSVREE